MRLSKDAEKLSIGSFIPRVGRDRALLRCLLLQDMVMLNVPPQTPVCVSGPLELAFRR